MTFTRSRILKTGVLAAVAVSALVFAMPGGAVIGGTLISKVPSWAALITVKVNGKTSSCSGALVGSRYVLTAAQCVEPTTTAPCAVGKPYPVGDITVVLGRTSLKVPGKAYAVVSLSRNVNSSVSADGQCVLKHDVVLLKLNKIAKGAPLWLAPSQLAVIDGTGALLYGYGQTALNKPKSFGVLHSTADGDWMIDTQCDLASAINATCVDKVAGTSAGVGVDTGGPWTMSVDGKPVAALVFSGYDLAGGFAYGTGVTDPSTAAWLDAKLGIPNVGSGNIVRNSATGKSFLIDGQGYRRFIPDASTAACLAAKGAKTSSFPNATIAMMAAKVAPAVCTNTNLNVLIAGLGDGGWTLPNDNIADLLGNTAGYAVTESADLPSDLSSFGQIWWVATDPPSAAEQSQLVAFERAGGGVFLTGERSPCCDVLNSADTTMINLMVTGGGVTAGGDSGDLCTCTAAMPVNQTVTGNLSSAPLGVTQWTVSQPGGMQGVPASSVFAYYQPGDISTRRTVAAAWNRASLIGNGRLVVFMDINWTEQGYRAGNWSDVAQNVAFFLSGLSSPPGP